MEAEPVTLLALDLGGVLLAEGVIESVFAEIAPARAEELEVCRRELRRPFWAGELDEVAWWHAIADAAGVRPEPYRWRKMLIARLQPLPAVKHLASWRAQAGRIALLSNHRHEWLAPILGPCGIAAAVDFTFISSETGAVKPDPQAYALLTALAPAGQIVFVDDQQRNLDAAAEACIRTLRADREETWTQRLDALLDAPATAFRARLADTLTREADILAQLGR